MERNVILVDFSFAKYVTDVKSVSSFLTPPVWKRLQSLFTHKVYLPDNSKLEDIVAGADVIVMFDTRKDYDLVASRIESVCKPTAKLIFYSWNPIIDSDAHARLGKRWLKTTFSKEDALAYNFEYVGSFYFSNQPTKKLPIKYDGFFIGRDKGRRELLHNVATLYERKQLSSKVILVDNRKALFDKHYSWRMDYTEVCKYVMESNSVIEILQDGQEGISLRVFESLFFEKKLVTNNRHIVDYDFYDSRNVFILGMDDEARFKEFILSPYIKVDEEILSRYRMHNWLNKMLSL